MFPCRLLQSKLRLALALLLSLILLRLYGRAARRHLRKLDSARASIADCTAAVAIARRYLGLGGAGDDQEA